ncbi:MAG: DEAD/DEAH box helicase [Termitinemataceae bacterium]
MEFTELSLHPDLQRGIAEAGYVTCTPVQEQVLKNAFGGHDLYVQSQTGTGKTAAFLIVIFQRLLTEPLIAGKKALIMVPTRELAVQVEEEAKILGKYLPFKVGSFYGGVGYTHQQQLLRENVQIMVGTPGRVLDLNSSGQMNLMDLAFLVIDEADRMFDMGFYPDLRQLIKVVPPVDRRQTMLFSATLNTWVKNLAWEYTHEPIEIEIAPENITVDEIEQQLYHVSSEDKFKLLLGILQQRKVNSAIIFCNTKRYAEIVAKRLRINDIPCEFIIGDLPQVKRIKIIEDVKAGKTPILVATDVAARGLDIEGLEMVINYDLPNEAENYIHRIGRTARAGKSGIAISLAGEQDVYELPAIEKYLGKKIPSQIATEELFAEDKSEGMHIRTDYYDTDSEDRRIRSHRGTEDRSGGRRSEGRTGERRSAGGRLNERGPSSHRNTERRQSAHRSGESRPGDQRPSDRRAGERKAHSKGSRGLQTETRQGNNRKALGTGTHSAPAARQPDLSSMTFEERLAYYRAKYKGPEPRTGSAAHSNKAKKINGAGADKALRTSGTTKSTQGSVSGNQTIQKEGFLKRLIAFFLKKPFKGDTSK